jgi:hypothetical protein
MNQKLIAIARGFGRVGLFVVLVVVFGAAGCKQGIGERCQVNSDCASNICSKSDPQVCVGSDEDQNQTDIDAAPPVLIDAAIPDAAPAPIDAPVDGP